MKNDEWFRTRAKELYNEDGQIEVDDNAQVSAGNDAGAYVEAWVWVPLENNRAAGSVWLTKREFPLCRSVALA